ncbi:phosphate/phosphite/phosphonate ABC transporter substrate-binding protein [Magnetococcus sp. PR-3]|uniref:phosphate/phosphite/phosphonate ABC transporter substrate-binding protein n=1 Tax=Magnetococcus sp. PR-3 TaxID=3120355 RepID=UPI002FCE0B24
MTKFWKPAVYAVLLMFLVSPVHAQDPKTLTLGFMPYLSAKNLLEKYTPLARYLGEQLGQPVRLEIARNYQEHIERTGRDELDIAFLGGSPYVTIGDTYGKKPLLARYAFEGSPYFRAVIFTANNSDISSLKQLKGKKVAFGNINSTLSTQVPLYMMMQRGVGLAQLGLHKHLRNHENVLHGVQFGVFDAGAVAEEVFREHMHLDIRLLAHSPMLSTHVFVARSTMSKGLQQRIRDALQTLHTTEKGGEVLKSINRKLSAFVPVKDTDYDLHRKILDQVLPALKEP